MKSAMIQFLAQAGQKDLEKSAMVRIRGQQEQNPALQAVAMHMMQMPPQNLPVLASLYAQKLEKDLRRDLEQPDPIDEMEADPLHQENKRLRRILTNMRSKMEMVRLQREMARLQGEVAAMQGMAANPAAAAAAGGLPPEAGGVSPEMAAAAAQPANSAVQGPTSGPPVGGAPSSAPQAPPGSASIGVGPVEAASM